MKVAISCTGNSADAAVDQRFGRCAYFAFYDTDTKELEFEANPAKDSSEGAGPAAVAFVANKNVGKIVSGEFGFKMKGMLTDLKIQMVIMKENKTVREITGLLNQ